MVFTLKTNLIYVDRVECNFVTNDDLRITTSRCNDADTHNSVSA
jgi:hypothetical protein